jgi:hypothetical protein
LTTNDNTALYKLANQNQVQNDYPIHQLQEDEGVNWIVICEHDKVYDQTNSYFKIIRQPNGDIYLKQIDIFSSSKNKRGHPEALPTQPDDQDYGE